MTDADWIDVIRTLAKTVRDLRIALNWSQQRVANLAGTSQGAISRVESGRCRVLPFHTVVTVGRALAVGARSLESPLTPATKALLDFVSSVTGEITGPPDPDILCLTSTYHQMKPEQRAAFMQFFKATTVLFHNPPPTRAAPAHNCADACPEHHVETA